MIGSVYAVERQYVCGTYLGSLCVALDVTCISEARGIVKLSNLCWHLVRPFTRWRLNLRALELISESCGGSDGSGTLKITDMQLGSVERT